MTMICPSRIQTNRTQNCRRALFVLVDFFVQSAAVGGYNALAKLLKAHHDFLLRFQVWHSHSDLEFLVFHVPFLGSRLNFDLIFA